MVLLIYILVSIRIKENLPFEKRGNTFGLAMWQWVYASFRWYFLPSGKKWKLIVLSEALQGLKDRKLLVTRRTPKNICCTKGTEAEGAI